MRRTQCMRILDKLDRKGTVSLPEIMDMRIARYGGRIWELRKQGMDIKTHTERCHEQGGLVIKKTWYMYVPKTENGQYNLNY